MSDELASRVLDLSLEDGLQRSPLSGLFPPDLQVPTLSDSLQCVYPSYPKLHPESGQMVKIARSHSKRVLKKFPSMRPDYVIAIILYTMEDIPRENSLYFAMNAVLRAQNRALVRPWRDFIWLLLHALRELPACEVAVVMRGCAMIPSALGVDEEGSEFVWSAFSSTATKINVMESFLGSSGPCTMFQLTLTEPIARDIQAFSLFPQENEAILPPNVKFEVVSIFARNELTVVQCKQIDSLDSLLDLTPRQHPIPNPLLLSSAASTSLLGAHAMSEEEQLAFAIQESLLVSPPSNLDTSEEATNKKVTVPTAAEREAANRVDANGWTPLMHAVYKGDLQVAAGH